MLFGMPPRGVLVRPATSDDVAALGRMGAALLRAHHEFDRRRFLAPGIDPEAGYSAFLGAQLADIESLVAVAELDGEVVGYVYASVEPHSWKELRERAGFVHDVFVQAHARGGGVATALLQAAQDWCAARGLPRVLLWTATQNEAARQLFSRLGFRPTMVEMTRELA